MTIKSQRSTAPDPSEGGTRSRAGERTVAELVSKYQKSPSEIADWNACCWSGLLTRLLAQLLRHNPCGRP